MPAVSGKLSRGLAQVADPPVVPGNPHVEAPAVGFHEHPVAGRNHLGVGHPGLRTPEAAVGEVAGLGADHTGPGGWNVEGICDGLQGNGCGAGRRGFRCAGRG